MLRNVVQLVLNAIVNVFLNAILNIFEICSVLFGLFFCSITPNVYLYITVF